WAGTDGTLHTTVGDLGDGTNGLSTDGRVQAAGAVAAGTLGVTGAISAASLAATGAVSGASVSSSGSLSAADHNASSNVPTLGGGNGAKLWIQSSDPGGSASNGDLWFAA